MTIREIEGRIARAEGLDRLATKGPWTADCDEELANSPPFIAADGHVVIRADDEAEIHDLQFAAEARKLMPELALDAFYAVAAIKYIHKIVEDESDAIRKAGCGPDDWPGWIEKIDAVLSKFGMASDKPPTDEVPSIPFEGMTFVCRHGVTCGTVAAGVTMSCGQCLEDFMGGNRAPSFEVASRLPIGTVMVSVTPSPPEPPRVSDGSDGFFPGQCTGCKYIKDHLRACPLYVEKKEADEEPEIVAEELAIADTVLDFLAGWDLHAVLRIIPGSELHEATKSFLRDHGRIPFEEQAHDLVDVASIREMPGRKFQVGAIAEIARLREALKPFADTYDELRKSGRGVIIYGGLPIAAYEVARAAIVGTKGDDPLAALDASLSPQPAEQTKPVMWKYEADDDETVAKWGARCGKCGRVEPAHYCSMGSRFTCGDYTAEQNPHSHKPDETRAKRCDSACPGEHCMMCSGEACAKCGAGAGTTDLSRPRCEHDVLERHEVSPPIASKPGETETAEPQCAECSLAATHRHTYQTGVVEYVCEGHSCVDGCRPLVAPADRAKGAGKGYGAEVTACQALVRRLREGGIVICTGSLSAEEIALAGADGRMWVDSDHFGYVYMRPTGTLRLRHSAASLIASPIDAQITSTKVADRSADDHRGDPE